MAEKKKSGMWSGIARWLMRRVKKVLINLVDEKFVPFAQEKIDAGELDKSVDGVLAQVGEVVKDFIRKKL